MKVDLGVYVKTIYARTHDFPKIMKGITKEDPIMENLDVDKLEDLFK